MDLQVRPTREAFDRLAADWPLVPVWTELLADVAVYVNPMLPPERAVALWKSLREARCASKLSANDRRWLDLFEAIAARDAARMAALGTPLVDAQESSEGMRWQAFVAAVAGHAMSGNATAAQRLLELGERRLPGRHPFQVEHRRAAPDAVITRAGGVRDPLAAHQRARQPRRVVPVEHVRQHLQRIRFPVPGGILQARHAKRHDDVRQFGRRLDREPSQPELRRLLLRLAVRQRFSLQS